MKFSFEFLYSFGPTHTRKIETEVYLTAFNNIYITGFEEVCPLTKTDINSLDFVINRFFRVAL